MTDVTIYLSPDDRRLYFSIKDERCTLSVLTLNGTLECKEILSLEKTPSYKLLQLNKCDDPRQLGIDNAKALGALSDIHRHIVELTKLNSQGGQPNISALLLAFSLSAIFILYFRRYELFQEPWGCLNAWMHLLRLRYHTIIRLYARKTELEPDEQRWLRENLLPARRDWADFCQNADHHFLFSSQTQQPDEIKWPQPFTNVEDEVLIITRPSKDQRPYSYYLRDSGGRFLDRLIADWFLSSRSDWFGAFRLTGHRALALMRQHRKPTLALGLWSLLIGLLFGLAIRQWGAWQTNWLSRLLSLIYPLSLIGLLLGCAWRTAMDLLLPRLWAGVMVGYLPLFLTSELWKMAYDHTGSARRWSGIIGFTFIACLLTFSYLRWEVGNRLARTPGSTSVAVRRALWLTIYGWVVSVVSGLVIFSLFGTPMARACLANANGELPVGMSGTPAVFSNIHLSALFLFAPFALLIGVIVQVFWEEKPVTHPL